MRTAQQLQVNRDTAEFGQYFVKTYMHQKRQWANCYRQKAFINTNMYVEAFHHVLKYIYLNGKVNKRVDKCIHTLLKITRDKTFERLIKMTKGKKTKKITEIHKRQRITTLIEQCTDKETLQVVNGQLNTTIGLVKCHSKQYKPVLPQINNCEPSNKTKPQRPIFQHSKTKENSNN